VRACVRACVVSLSFYHFAKHINLYLGWR